MKILKGNRNDLKKEGFKRGKKIKTYIHLFKLNSYIYKYQNVFIFSKKKKGIKKGGEAFYFFSKLGQLTT